MLKFKQIQEKEMLKFKLTWFPSLQCSLEENKTKEQIKSLLWVSEGLVHLCC